jgi:hypothetical protein
LSLHGGHVPFQLPTGFSNVFGTMPGPTAEQDKRKAARETVDILHEISTLLVSARSIIEQ